MGEILNFEIIEEALEVYESGKTTQETADHINNKYDLKLWRHTIGNWTKKYNCNRTRSESLLLSYTKPRNIEHQVRGVKKYKVENIFDKSLNECSAWVLGLLYGDGCLIRKQDEHGRGDILIAVDLVGTEAVCNKVANIFHTNSPIKKSKTRECFNLRINDKNLADTIMKTFGMTPHKSRTMKFPNIPDHLLSHFVRGFWDADGCVTKQYNKYLSMQARSASIEFMQPLMDIVNKIAGSDRVLTQSSDETYGLSLSCRKALQFGKWLWKDSTDEIRCDKKYQKFLSIVEKMYPEEHVNIIENQAA